MKVGSFLFMFKAKKQERVLGIPKGEVGRGLTRGDQVTEVFGT